MTSTSDPTYCINGRHDLRRLCQFQLFDEAGNLVGHWCGECRVEPLKYKIKANPLVEVTLTRLLCAKIRHCWYVGDTTKDEAGNYYPVLVFENQTGHYPTNCNIHLTRSDAERLSAISNKTLGLTPEDVNAIVISSFRAQNLRDAYRRKHG